jgi:2-polyprenyl-6-methoxyphenol hydroxylase-like FAD-dependent oxidoreductase
MKAIIVGGGIGGLASALALTQEGWQVEVLERAPEFTEVGAGLSLWPNALRALDALGVGEPVRGRAVLEGQAGIRDNAGRWLSRTDTAELERRYGPSAMIHRADLLAVLRAAVPADALRLGATVTGVRPDGTVLHSGGESWADLVVGADGVRSVTRQSVWPDAPGPRYAGYTTWRVVTAPVPVAESSESWGRGERFGAPQRGQPRDWRHRGMGKGLVSERDLNSHVRDLRLCVAGRCREVHNRRSVTCMCVRGPNAPKYQCLLTAEFALDAAGGAR